MGQGEHGLKNFTASTALSPIHYPSELQIGVPKQDDLSWMRTLIILSGLKVMRGEHMEGKSAHGGLQGLIRVH